MAVERAPQPLLDGVVALVLFADRRVQPVGRTAAADRDPAVRGALRVEEQVPQVGDQHPALPADLGPDVVGQRLRRDHQRVEGQEPPALAGQQRRVRLGRAQDGARTDGALRAADAAGFQLEHLRVLVHDHAEALARRGQPADEAGGIDPRRVRGVAGGQAAGDVHAAVDLVGVQQRDVGGGGAARVGVVDAREQAPALRLAGRDEQRAGMVEAAVDALRGGDAADLLDRRVGLPLRPAHRVGAVALLVDGCGARDAARRPAAVPARGAVPRDLALQHDDPQVGLQLLEVVRRPQAGESGADDRHVVVRVSRQRGPRVQRPVDAVQPQAPRPVAGLVVWLRHRRDATRGSARGDASRDPMPGERTPAGWSPSDRSPAPRSDTTGRRP